VVVAVGEFAQRPHFSPKTGATWLFSLAGSSQAVYS
jgi:hypothetical protein